MGICFLVKVALIFTPTHTRHPELFLVRCHQTLNAEACSPENTFSTFSVPGNSLNVGGAR